jgi:hypothetical protein
MPSPLDLHYAKCLPRRVSPAPRDRQSRELPSLFLFASLLLCVICTSCGAVGSDPPPPVSVTVTPNSAQPYQGESVQFSASVQNAGSSAVTWQVNGTPGGNPSVGTINPTGLYAAPALVPNPPTVTVTAALQSDSTKTGSSSVTILSLSSITGTLVVSPSLSSLTTSQTLQFQILTPGISNNDVNWAVSGGTITPGGMYTPPGAQGAYTVKASLIANPNTIGTAQADVTNFPGMLTWRNDNARSGVNSQELALAPETVSSSTFGKIFSCPIDGYVYAQPLYVPNLAIPGNGIHNVVFVATEKDSVFAFDADTKPCVQLWQASLIPGGSQPIAFPNLDVTGSDLVPFVGITGTPVIDERASTLFVVAATQTIALNPSYSHMLYALDLATGSKIQLAGVGTARTPDVIFNSLLENQRPALLLDNGTVYIAFGSYGGQCAGESTCEYHGWLFGYDSSSLQQTGVFDVTPNAIQGGIWQSGGGPSVDPNHNLFVVTGNGPPNEGKNYSDSFLRMGTNGGLSVTDYFIPCDQGQGSSVNPNALLQSGSSAPVLVPDSADSPAQPHLLIGGSKEGFLYVVNRDAMGGFPSPCSDSLPRVQAIQTGGPILSTPIFWKDAVYAAPGNGKLQSFPMPKGILASSPTASQSPDILGPQGATPVISSNGTTNAILWLIDSSGALAAPTNTPAILRAYDPNNLSNEIYNSAMAAGSRDAAGPAVKFTVPTVANGKVYVGTQTELDVYGLLQ